jgi:benzylsuccinate CoA-transferase BbsE subunit
VTGRGQNVHQSAQQRVIFSTHNLVETWDLTKSNLVRSGNIFTMRPPPFVGTRLIFKCKDGYVNYPFNVGSIGAKNNPILIEWMRNDGINVDEIEDFQWDKIDMLDFPKEMRNKLTELVQQFFLKHTKKELYEESTKRRLLLYPVFTMEDLVNDPQLEFRNFWEEVSHPLLKGAIKYPHPCALLIGIDPRGYTPPPYIGEHNMEIYQNLGLSKDEIISLQAKGVI